MAFGGVGTAVVQHKLRGRARFRLSSTKALQFQVPSADPAKPIPIFAEKVWLINQGRKSINNVEMIMPTKPAQFYFKPAVRYEEGLTDDGKFFIRVSPPIGPKQTLELYLLNAPLIEGFTSDVGAPVQLPIADTPVVPKWKSGFFLFFATVGLVVVIFWIAFDIIPWASEAISSWQSGGSGE